MDRRLIPADVRTVRRLMAESILSAPAITADQGEIRLAPHQVEAAARVLALLRERGGAVLADATGLGKTFVAAAVARLHVPSLVVAPAALRGMWRESLGRAGVHARVESYETFSRGIRIDARPALLILDEAHHARNPKARRYAALADLAWGARVLLLTATPIHNRTRDLRALIALFLGSAVDQMSEADLLRSVVRRTPDQTTTSPALPLPRVNAPRWFTVSSDAETFRAINVLPPAVPASDGRAAHALLLLGLIRAWSSSEAALRESLRRRLRRAASLDAALESGRLLDRRELDAWPVVDGALQLGFPELLSAGDSPVDASRIRSALQEHVDGVRAILRCLDRNEGRTDRERAAILRSLVEPGAAPIVAFTQFADTANAMFQSCVTSGGVALVTGKGARVAAGRVTVDEVVKGFDVEDESRMRRAMPLRILIATDVLSEGLCLRRAGILVHLDLPWTMARLEQRVGRLRRFGSRHESIEVHAIGPPASARELVPVMRALQRKARLASSVVGESELRTSLPLLGQRFVRASAAIGRRDAANATELLRMALRGWADEHKSMPRSHSAESPLALGLVATGDRQMLVAVSASGVTEDVSAVLRTVEVLSDVDAATVRAAPRPIVESIDRWLEERRGRDLARVATEAPSTAHSAVLRMLQKTLHDATRTERAHLTMRMQRNRRCVLAARGAGAEAALQRLMDDHGNVTALEALLATRTAVEDESPASARLVALLCFEPPDRVIAFVSPSVTAGSPHPGRPRSSTLHAARDATSV